MQKLKHSERSRVFAENVRFHKKKVYKKIEAQAKKVFFLSKRHAFNFWSTNFDENLPTRFHLYVYSVGQKYFLTPL